MRFPIARCHRINFYMKSGRRITQDVWSYDVKFKAGDCVSDIGFKWANESECFNLIRCDQVEAFSRELGPLKWRGFKS